MQHYEDEENREEDVEEEPLPRVDLADFSSLIVLDLEWNYPATRYRREQRGVCLGTDIIQIGAVKTDTALRKTDTYDELLFPKTYPKMNHAVIEVTDITDAMLEGRPAFEEEAPKFLDWCGEDAAFFTWGVSDIDAIADCLTFDGMEERVGHLPRCFDMQVMFDDQFTGEGRSFALNYAIWKLGIEQDGIAHNAFGDALNTLEGMRRFDFSEGIEYYEI